MNNLFSSKTLEYPTPSPYLPNVGSAPKIPKHHHTNHPDPPELLHRSLLPGLPDHIAHLCLSLVPPSTLFSVCRSWRRLIYSPSFPPFLSLYALFLPIDAAANLSDSLHFCSYDPISGKWNRLPPPPPDPPLRFLFSHPSFISRKLPIQSVAVAGNLVLIAATADHFLPALSKPLVFNPISEKWTHGPPLSNPRRWCAAGASGGVVYVASGVGSQYNTDVARSVEKWDLDISPNRPWKWQKMNGLKNGKFSRDAIDAVGWRGKLCMVNVKGYAAKEGIIYDVGTDTWQDMPEGMLVGWKGPAAAMAEETIYAVDESKGALKKYDHVKGTWADVLENPMFKGAQQAVADRGRVCVLCADGLKIAVVDVAAPPPGRMWVVEAPPGLQAVAIHVLPRHSLPDFNSSKY